MRRFVSVAIALCLSNCSFDDKKNSHEDSGGRSRLERFRDSGALKSGLNLYFDQRGNLVCHDPATINLENGAVCYVNASGVAGCTFIDNRSLETFYKVDTSSIAPDVKFRGKISVAGGWVGSKTFCGLSDQGVICWGFDGRSPQLLPIESVVDLAGSRLGHFALTSSSEIFFIMSRPPPFSVEKLEYDGPNLSRLLTSSYGLDSSNGLVRFPLRRPGRDELVNEFNSFSLDQEAPWENNGYGSQPLTQAQRYGNISRPMPMKVRAGSYGYREVTYVNSAIVPDKDMPLCAIVNSMLMCGSNFASESGRTDIEDNIADYNDTAGASVFLDATNDPYDGLTRFSGTWDTATRNQNSLPNREQPNAPIQFPDICTGAPIYEASLAFFEQIRASDPFSAPFRRAFTNPPLLYRVYPSIPGIFGIPYVPGIGKLSFTNYGGGSLGVSEFYQLQGCQNFAELTIDDNTVPVSKVTKVTVGLYNTCVLADGWIYCSGQQFGHGLNALKYDESLEKRLDLRPIARKNADEQDILFEDEYFIDVDIDNKMTRGCGLSNQANLYCWGASVPTYRNLQGDIEDISGNKSFIYPRRVNTAVSGR